MKEMRVSNDDQLKPNDIYIESLSDTYNANCVFAMKHGTDYTGYC